MKPKIPKEFIPYDIGDWIISRAKSAKIDKTPQIYKVLAFSGNYVSVTPFWEIFPPHITAHLGDLAILIVTKKDYTKATNRDIARAVAWRLKGE